MLALASTAFITYSLLRANFKALCRSPLSSPVFLSRPRLGLGLFGVKTRHHLNSPPLLFCWDASWLCHNRSSKILNIMTFKVNFRTQNKSAATEQARTTRLMTCTAMWAELRVNPVPVHKRHSCKRTACSVFCFVFFLLRCTNKTWNIPSVYPGLKFVVIFCIFPMFTS